MKQWWKRVVVFPLLQNIARYLYRVHVFGEENLPTGVPVVFASNHASHFDTPLLISLLGQWARRQGIMLYVVGARDYWGAERGIKALMRECFHVLLIERGSGAIKQVRHDLTAISQVLHRGHAVIMYPEGGRQSNPLCRASFKEGVSVITRKVDSVPLCVVPVFLWGTHLVWPKRKRFFSLRLLFRARIRVKFGEVIDPHHYPTDTLLARAIEQAVDDLRQQYTDAA